MPGDLVEVVAQALHPDLDYAERDIQGMMREQARAALKAIEEAYRIVPKEPTLEMVTAGRDALRKAGLLPAYTDTGSGTQQPIMEHMLKSAVWPAMLDASPSPDTGGMGHDAQ